MVGSLRSGKVVKKVMSASEIDQYLEPLLKNIEGMNLALNNLRDFFDEKLKNQQREILNLQTRLLNLEHRMIYNEHLSMLNNRKIDDSEQFSRKTNLRLRGIKVKSDDSPERIMKLIQEQVTALDLGIEASEYDRCHRIGGKNYKNGILYQDVLLKLCFWKTRNILYQNRKKLHFKVFADLTHSRSDLFEYAKNEINNDTVANRLVEFVFVDLNCKLKVFSKTKHFYAFNSEIEFRNIVSRLDREQTASVEFLDDEKLGLPDKVIPYDLYY